MGGSCSYHGSSRSRCEVARDTCAESFRKFKRTGNLVDLVSAQRAFLADNSAGFIAEFAKLSGIKRVEDIPKEFPETEYEVKFDMQVSGNGKEPEIIAYLDAFDFPASKAARFLKDPANNVSIGVNNFYGDGLDERLVVIEKAGNLYLKEKGHVVLIDAPVQFREAVIKRSEKRWQASFEEATKRAEEVCREPGVSYRGKVRKEKGDVFIMDTSDGRIYSFTITRAHLVKPGTIKETDVQRQLEIEYAGYIPGFSGFQKDSEQQIVQGMVDLGKYTFALYHNAPIASGWRMNLELTGERKYDFVSGRRAGQIVKGEALALPLLPVQRKRVRATVLANG
ncbi:MAG: hypothetical protein KKB21_01845 [Nanoarchaeota archaeon]|nr:hypothetical protein [Nanoarchaeota archaeon]